MIRKSMHSKSLHSKILKCRSFCLEVYISLEHPPPVIKTGLACDESCDRVEVYVNHSRHSGATACALHTRITPECNAPGNSRPPHSANSRPQ